MKVLFEVFEKIQRHMDVKPMVKLNVGPLEENV